MYCFIPLILILFSLNQINLTDPDEHRGTIELITSKGYEGNIKILLPTAKAIYVLGYIPFLPIMLYYKII